MKTQYVIITAVTLFFVCVAFPTLAQIVPQIPQIPLPRVPSVFDGPPSLPAAPVDGGLSLLAAAGIGYGMKKMKNRKK